MFHSVLLVSRSLYLTLDLLLHRHLLPFTAYILYSSLMAFLYLSNLSLFMYCLHSLPDHRTSLLLRYYYYKILFASLHLKTSSDLLLFLLVYLLLTSLAPLHLYSYLGYIPHSTLPVIPYLSNSLLLLLFTYSHIHLYT